MAYRLWNQISGVKYLKHGSLKPYSSLSEQPQIFGKKSKKQSWQRHNSISGIRNLNDIRDAPSGTTSESCYVLEQAGRFVTNAPGVLAPEEAVLRTNVRQRIAGVKNVSKQADEYYQRSCEHPQFVYRPREHTHPAEYDDKIGALKRAYARKVTVARFQPHSLAPFGSKVSPSFEREDVRPRRFAIAPTVDSEPETLEWMRNVDARLQQIPEEPAVLAREDDAASTRSDASARSDVSTTDSIHSNTSEWSDHTARKIEAGPSKKTSHIGYGFTQMNPIRKFSTFSKAHTIPTRPAVHTNLLQVRTKKKKSKMDPRCKPKPKKGALFLKDCTKQKHKVKGKKKKVYKHKGRWTACECCPEMLDCDVTECYVEYRFPCPCEDYPPMCPLDCPPPCEHRPPGPVPLCRPKKCPVYQKVKQCLPDCDSDKLKYLESKCLKRLPPGNCPCVEPFVPSKLPLLKFVKKRVYQCQKVCEEPCIEPLKHLAPPKQLPNLDPGECPPIQPCFTDVPPLPRLNLNIPYKVKECKPPCIVKIEQPKCYEKKQLPPIKSDCYCIEPKPLKHVRLVRLPPICVCPEPPNPKCIPEPCPLRADDVCKWEYPVKKLKNFWCPNCKMPISKYKWCHCHTRGMKKCKHDPCKRCKTTKCPIHKGKKCPPIRNFSTLTRRPIGEQPCASADMPSTSTAVAVESSQAKATTLFGASGLRLQPSPHVSALMGGLARHFHLTASTQKRRKHKKFTDKQIGKTNDWCGVRCPKFDNNCCPPKARDSCEPKLKPLCCKPKQSPYPSFSECSEFHELLTCECKETMPYLQPNQQHSKHYQYILPDTPPKWKIIDPLLEEHCVLNDLCRPKGITYTCETFHQGEKVPITQYECFSPHRLPCCERDQICDFHRDPSERTCEGRRKQLNYYRCECACEKRKKCKKAKKHKLDACYDQIRKLTKRRYSTMASRGSFQENKNGLLSNDTQADANKNICRFKSSRAGATHEYWPKCPPCKKKHKCGKGIDRLMERIIPKRPKEEPEGSAEISRMLKNHFRKSLECAGSKVKRKLLVEQAKCAAKRVGMRLVPDHSKCCKHQPECKLDGIGATDGGKASCGPMPECRRPKNVCSSCDPRWEVDQCKGKRWEASCCSMPYRLSGGEFRAMQPACCKMPIPLCNRNCMRVRSDCMKEYVPCCVIESPYPAFSDCHPPFKRLARTECQMQEFLEDRSSRKITEMMQAHSLKKGGHKRGFHTTTMHLKDVTILDRVLSFFERKKEAKGLHEPVNCKCGRCVMRRKAIKPDLGRNVSTALPADTNIPEALFSKEEIFQQVDKENLISLAPEVPTPMDKVKCYLFNKASKADETAPKLPVDGFEMFAKTTPVQAQSASESEAKPSSASKIETEAPKAVVAPAPPAAIQGKIQHPNVRKAQSSTTNVIITLRGTSDLYYLTGDGSNAVNLRPQPASNAIKVKVVAHPVCTHIMLDSGELLLEHQYHLMKTILPMKNRMYIPHAMSHEEYVAIEKKTDEKIIDELQKVFEPRK